MSGTKLKDRFRSLFRSKGQSASTSRSSSLDSAQEPGDATTALSPSLGPGPFKATKIWEDLVEHVKSKVELKRRRHKFRYVDSCFTGANAADVVLEFLLSDKDTFSADLSREKAIKVCQMLIDRKVLQSATDKPGTGKPFEDSGGKLFQFTGDYLIMQDSDMKRNSITNLHTPSTSSGHLYTSLAKKGSSTSTVYHRMAIGAVPPVSIPSLGDLVFDEKEEEGIEIDLKTPNSLSFAVLSPIAQFYEIHLAKTESQRSELLASGLQSKASSDVTEEPKCDVRAPQQVMDSSDISESFFGKKPRGVVVPGDVDAEGDDTQSVFEGASLREERVRPVPRPRSISSTRKRSKSRSRDQKVKEDSDSDPGEEGRVERKRRRPKARSRSGSSERKVDADEEDEIFPKEEEDNDVKEEEEDTKHMFVEEKEEIMERKVAEKGRRRSLAKRKRSHSRSKSPSQRAVLSPEEQGHFDEGVVLMDHEYDGCSSGVCMSVFKDRDEVNKVVKKLETAKSSTEDFHDVISESVSDDQRLSDVIKTIEDDEGEEEEEEDEDAKGEDEEEEEEEEDNKVLKEKTRGMDREMRKIINKYRKKTAKTEALMMHIDQLKNETDEISRLYTQADKVTLALRNEIKDLKTKMAAICDQSITTVRNETKAKTLEPMCYRRYLNIRNANEAASLLASIKGRQRALSDLELLVYRKQLILSHKLPGQEEEVAKVKTEKHVNAKPYRKRFSDHLGNGSHLGKHGGLGRGRLVHVDVVNPGQVTDTTTTVSSIPRWQGPIAPSAVSAPGTPGHIGPHLPQGLRGLLAITAGMTIAGGAGAAAAGGFSLGSLTSEGVTAGGVSIGHGTFGGVNTGGVTSGGVTTGGVTTGGVTTGGITAGGVTSGAITTDGVVATRGVADGGVTGSARVTDVNLDLDSLIDDIFLHHSDDDVDSANESPPTFSITPSLLDETEF